MSNIINIYNKNKEFIRYCSISIICTIILYLIYFFITKINPKAYILANFIAYLVSFSLLFYLNQKLFNSIPTNKRNKITQIVDDEYENEPDEGNEIQGEHPNVGYIEQRSQQRHEQARQEGPPVEHALGKRRIAAACGLSAPLHVIAGCVERKNGHALHDHKEQYTLDPAGRRNDIVKSSTQASSLNRHGRLTLVRGLAVRRIAYARLGASVRIGDALSLRRSIADRNLNRLGDRLRGRRGFLNRAESRRLRRRNGSFDHRLLDLRTALSAVHRALR